jgi:uncharacterized protein (TIGR02145 family)
MKISDIKRLFLGLNRDDNPAFLKEGEYIDLLNGRTVSSEDEQEAGQAETLRGEVEILINVNAELTYYGQAIGGEFQYAGYEEVAIGSQVWMKKNWDANYPGSKVYNDLEANRAIYGGLYTWDQVMSSDFAPDGWRVPTEADVDALLTYLGGALIAGGKMKEPALDHWLTPNTGADDSSGFKGLGGGKYASAFDLLQEMGLFWLQDEYVSEVTDIDGNIYQTEIIGEQEWIVGNLKTTTYADGTAIPNIILDANWIADITGAYCWYNNDMASYKTIYGALYNWYAVNNAHGLVYLEREGIPETGWRVATQADYIALITAFGGNAVAGGHLKDTGIIYWNAPNTGADNSSELTVRGGGVREAIFGFLKALTVLWSSTEVDAANAYGIYLTANNASTTLGGTSKHTGSYVRLVKDI